MKTDRIFIIPRFKCSYKKKFVNIPNKNCTFADIFHLKYMENNFMGKYRESVRLIIFIIIIVIPRKYLSS